MPTEEQMKSVVACKIQDEDLLQLNDVVNRVDFGLGLTIFVKGSVISGSLISGKKYYTALAGKLKESGEVGTALAVYFDQKAESQYTKTSDDFIFPNNFLHIDQVEIRRDDGRMGQLNGGMLRIKIEEIEGYILGNIGNPR
ncbi:TPA: gas vesicle protein [Citrobacter koseri]|uniref:gas vesicle protein n=1 Tax=Citrobacter koseri TaxID=545 RepID=UPI001A19A3AF|nr:gas vesicle protein [Citrobacter koseri]HDQ2604340.1 gas vesicle protein [Citrobacter koseri]